MCVLCPLSLIIFKCQIRSPVDRMTSHTLFLGLVLVLDRLASVGAMVWIGLNHLKDRRGWQWSDRAPLSLVNFTTGTDNHWTIWILCLIIFISNASELLRCTVLPSALPASPLQENRQCGVYNSALDGHWQSLSCESAMPYICKKTPNDTRRAEPLGETP